MEITPQAGCPSQAIDSAIAYNNDAAFSKTSESQDNWTTEQLIKMSNSFSDAYGSGL